jgi:ComF family protein
MSWFNHFSTHCLPRLPSQCAICRGWGEQRVCSACVTRFTSLEPRCLRCAHKVPASVQVCGACTIKPPAFTRTLSAVDYTFPWDKLVLQLKFNAGLDLVSTLANLVWQAHRADTNCIRPDYLLPVPLHPARLRERGFNQAWELCKHLSKKMGIPTSSRLLHRTKDSPHQLAHTPAQRSSNVHKAFTVAPQKQALLQGRTIALVDDVITTGATATEISKVLLDYGAARVDVWTVARTPRPGTTSFVVKRPA